ncbi:serine-type D-Ala-D-Ala carboxypeptidase [Dinoroseobacter shibae DFL 12 = DSM 16493]|jgi:D-alanyl-D-alanine carboxypeptidase (penicillin-binding protein 5/6)|uniref:serine-type D-Ala-D-Ala carboxypeptidase n=1 Tax=Dinoroseobacter shibae (strain DSM 16493 / NCIMB 14021 / DFL 12) TaxID=398580 RepID=A8LRW1_DINSH|nr:serine-type D-Ala-D-Ala carboxypeptidase [Dinoroseobacter shibae DFL 12 = DSM 16493]
MGFLRLICLSLALGLGLAPAAQAAFETRAEAAYVVDVTTGTVLLEKNADVPLPPASMSKLMTLYMLFEALEKNPAVTLDTTFRVSARAMAKGGSTMFLTERDRPTAEDLIKGIIVQSGNDATVVVAEGLAGTEEAFSRLMTEKGAAIGLTQSTFTNSSGWPDPQHRMSMRDLGILTQRIIEDYPEYYGYFAMSEWGFDGRAPQNRFNRNPLLKLDIGADGLKTGHTQEAGYGLVGSAQQGARRIIFVITGLETDRARAEESERIVSWAFRQFVEKDMAEAGRHLADLPVWVGEAETVGLVSPEDIRPLVPMVASGSLVAEIEADTPIAAPITAGQQLAELVITGPEMEPQRYPLVAETDVAKGGAWVRMQAAAEVLYRELTREDAPDAPQAAN